MLARMFRRLFENEGAGPKLRDDVVPWSAMPGNAVPWESGPLATPGRAGFAPAGGLPGQVFGVSDDGLSYGWGGAPASVIVGKIDLLPFRVADLTDYAPGWHFCNGDLYPLSSAVGAALAALPENYKTDWGVAISGENISIPNMFYTDGRGYFLRADAAPGKKVQDAIRNIAGWAGYSPYGGMVTPSGPFYSTATYKGDCASGSTGHCVYMDVSRVVPTAAENRPLHITMTPAIFLGV